MLGFIAGRAVGEEWEIENIAVAGPARRRGLGTRLLGEFLDLARDRGAEAVFLEVRESNLAARRLYEKWAFVGTWSTQGLLSRAGRGCDCLSAGACLRMHQSWCNQSEIAENSRDPPPKIRVEAGIDRVVSLNLKTRLGGLLDANF